MTGMDLDVVVSAGADEPRALVVTEKNGADISTCTYEVQLAPAGEQPTEAGWASVTPTFSTGAGSTHPNVAKIPCQVNAGTAAAGNDYRICARITDSGDKYVVRAPEILHAV